ncbi:GDP-mannose 4,6-dehydratase [Luteibacter sp. SG786]|uniref:GDP-mannose 4,6-dehydratase n=1 Tax=Luteibacter sp. SG786 TaxID=2587130 RepID=UPI00141DCDF3|nr:GDP-mannose 4,6-dehydratase [Luteibacter sp. SG786]NII56420.1 GDP-4-dehydro-6-deoxy-D-mannose reductase [Luteibacter sp. SG786]
MSGRTTTSTLYLTGASGFVGKHVLAEAQRGVFGDTGVASASAGLDLRDAVAVLADIDAIRPDTVVHLAAQSFVPESFVRPRDTIDTNLIGTLNLLEALKSTGFRGRMLYVSSGDVYGAVPEADLPVVEAQPPMPRSPYAVSKVAAELLCRQYQLSVDFEIVVARPFNHIGPGQDVRFVVPSLARQVARIAAGMEPAEILAGDIDVTRDFSDVRDVVGAYAALLRSGRAGEIYNVCSGREVKIRDILMILCRQAGVAPDIRQDAAKLRPSEQRRMVASSGKLAGDTGWAPQWTLERTLQQILDTFSTKDSL